MGLLAIEKKAIVITALSLGLVITIGFAASLKHPDRSNTVTHNSLNQSVPVTDQVTNSANAQGSPSQAINPKASVKTSLLNKPQSISKTIPNDVAKDIPKDIPKSWLDQVQKDIAQREYHITWQDNTTLPKNKSAWQAPNRAHNFRTYFTDRSEEHTSELQSH